MMPIRSSCFALLAALLPAAVSAATPSCPATGPWPPSFRLEYGARASWGIFALNGDNALTLKRDADSYQLTSETNAGALFSARQQSRGRIGSRGLVPAEYSERNASKPQMTTRFDWTGQTVSFTETEDTVATAPQMQDRLSVTLQVAWTLRTSGAVTHQQVAGVRGASVYKFVSRGREDVDTPAGRFETVKVERPMDDSDDRLEVWLAPALCYLPVRTRFTDHKGTVIANELKAAHFDAP